MRALWRLADAQMTFPSGLFRCPPAVNVPLAIALESEVFLQRAPSEERSDLIYRFEATLEQAQQLAMWFTADVTR